jgi:hypothetical protein
MAYGTHPCPGGCGRQVENRSVMCIYCRNQQRSGPNSSRWKGGIAKNYYHWKKIQVQRYPEKDRARRMVYCAVKTGKLSKVGCQWPGCKARPIHTQFHHWSYEEGRELDVIELCRIHHEQVKELTKSQFEFMCEEKKWVVLQFS